MGGSTTTNENSSSQSRQRDSAVGSAGGDRPITGSHSKSPRNHFQQYQGQDGCRRFAARMQQGVEPGRQQRQRGPEVPPERGPERADDGGELYACQQISAPTSSQLAGYMNPYTQDVDRQDTADHAAEPGAVAESSSRTPPTPPTALSEVAGKPFSTRCDPGARARWAWARWRRKLNQANFGQGGDGRRRRANLG